MCYFRWRRRPWLRNRCTQGLRPDSQEAPALCEARETAREITQASEVLRGQSDIGLFFDYEADAMWHIQPHERVKLFWVGV